MIARYLRKLGSLRLRAMIVLIGVVITPLLFVWMSKPYELTISYRMQLIMEEARADVLSFERSAPLDKRALDAHIKAIAERHGLRIRLLDARHQVWSDHDYTVNNDWHDSFGALGFTQEQIARLKAYDESLPLIQARAEVIEASAGRSARGCTHSQQNKLLVCTMASQLEVGEGKLRPEQPLLLHTQAASPRAIRSLYDVRHQLLKLAGQVMVVALLLGLWLGWRMVSPLRVLRRQVIDRLGPPVSTKPVDVIGKDEVTDVAQAFNQLLAAIEAQRQANLGFMADVAHEIKNPVAAIRACSENMSKTPQIDEQRAARYARILRSSSERLDVLVSRFLELARAEAGLESEARVQIEIGVMIERIMESFGADERYQGVRFEVDIEPLTYVGAPGPLETAVRNLVDNAASFALAREPLVSVSLKAHKGHHVLMVEDKGPGIPPEDLDRIFDRFFTRRDDDQGTGLGLAMTRAVITAHGGELAVRSTLGEGTCFTIVLPLKSEA